MYDYSLSKFQQLFRKDLLEARPERGYNLLRKYGLIQAASDAEVSPSVARQFAIRQFMHRGTSSDDVSQLTEFSLVVPKLGPPAEENPASQRLEDSVPPLSDTIGTVRFWTPPVPLNEPHSMPNEQAHRRLVKRYRGWFDSLEFDKLITVAAGMRGMEKSWLNGWRTSLKPQRDPLDLKKLPASDLYLAKTHPLSAPSLHFAEWQTMDEMKASTGVDYTNASRPANFIEALDKLHRCISVEGNMKPAIVRYPEGKEHIKDRDFIRQYILFIPEKRGHELLLSKDWRESQKRYMDKKIGNFAEIYGSERSYVGRHKNIVVVSMPNVPIFEYSNHKIRRGILFGSQAMALAYTQYREGENEKIISPYMCRFTPMPDGHLDISIATNIGVKKITTITGDSVAQEKDCGIAAFDMYEGEAA